MKARITLAMACFIGFILCSAAVAYYPALIVRECPHCKAHVVQEDTLSGNTIGAKYYTDGKREAKMLPDHPALVKCPVCGGLFWVQESVEVDVGFEAAEGKQKVLAPSEKEMLNFLTGQELPKEKEFYLRMCCRWKVNDAWRHVANAKPSFSPEQVKNLEALSAPFDESLPGHRILKAEIARELGRFDEYLLLLSYQFDEDYGFVVSFIRKLAQKKVRAVKPFEQGK
ncbi:MAG: hypothetical protein MUC57_02245 [Desulfobacterales bacterium]|jgi:hypothetical protein|nr:hypothetical protein [Desulfobacterales bacterium]